MRFTFIIPDMSWLYDYKAQFSLGILYVASILKQENWEVSIFDTNTDDINNIGFSNVYGFSAVYNTYPNCVDLAKQVKKKYPNSKIILGGAHSSLTPNTIDKIFDSIFVGEAEETIRLFLKDLQQGYSRPLYIETKSINIDNYLPERSILTDDYIRTASVFTGGKTYDPNGSTSIMFSRGCPYSCAFCASPQIYKKKVRFRPVKSIIQEIQHIKNTYNIRQFRIQDDTFTIKSSYLEELCNAIEPLEIYYRCSTRVNHINNKSVEWLYKSGCREIGLGIEIANDTALDKLRKEITVTQAEQAINSIRKYPIIIRCFFMIGTPFDTEETIQDNINFIERNNITNAVVANFIPFPGTDMYINREKYNIKLIKEKTCMNIAKHLELIPNILRYDIDENKHTIIMRQFYDYMVKKGFI